MKKVRRISAVLTIAVIIGLIIGTIVCAITGSKLFFGMLFLMIVVPVVLYVFMWFTKLVSGKEEDNFVADEAINETPKTKD
ncbi:MAG: DUF2207 domain-containing protein [Lachnospiraceae bacterium]|jgi:uncharacterized protein YacL|nr:DUF2207 domain-containing protein [Lachnospiraceae bacterium]